MTRTAEIIATEINNWNMNDVRELRDLICELSNFRDENDNAIDVQAYIDMSALPSAAIPDDIDTGYPVWAVDMSGYALVGDSARDIETLDEVRAE